MDSFNQQPPEPWPATPFYPATPEPQPDRSFSGVRRAVATIALSGMLLAAGGAAVVFAASPDPSASPAPAATSNPSGGTTTPGTNPGTTTPKTHNCPNMGSGGTNRGSTPVTPTTPTAPSSPSV